MASASWKLCSMSGLQTPSASADAKSFSSYAREIERKKRERKPNKNKEITRKFSSYYNKNLTFQRSLYLFSIKMKYAELRLRPYHVFFSSSGLV